MTLRRSLLAAAAALPGLLALAAQAQPGGRIELAARPTAVTVYPDQATVTRTGSAEIPAGDSTLVITGIPAGILPDSVNARGQASARVAIGAVDLRQASFDPAAANSRRAAIEARMRELDDQASAIDVHIAAATAQQSLVERLAGGFVEAQRRPPAPATTGLAPRLAEDPAAWRAAWDAVREGTRDAAEALRRARLERRGLEEAKARLQAELATVGGRPSGTLEIAVAVRAEAATRIELSVTYQLRGAAWRPVYEIRLDSTARRIALRQEAIVTQRSGEDWDGVALTLSTARPSGGLQPPQLAPLRIALAAEEDRARGAAMRAIAPAPPAPIAGVPPQEAAARRDEEARPQLQADHQLAAVAARGLAVEFAIPGAATVRADGTERRLRIGDSAAEATLAARTVPRLDARAFLAARFASPARVPLLPGQAALYLDGVFVGRAALPLARPDEAITLPFGADDRIAVLHEPQEQRRSTEFGLRAGRTTTEARESLFVIRNLHDRPFEITVLDQLPVSGDENLTVAMTAEPAPTARDVEDRPGVVAWTHGYAPNEERRIRFGYAVTAPRDRTVIGLPPR